jgi:hypothetical protein
MSEKGSFEKFTATTGGEEECHIIEQKDLFFTGLLASYGIERLEVFATSSSRYLAFDDFEQYDDRIRRSDDVLHTLTLFDEVIGLVYDRRNDTNFHSVSFHASELSEFGQTKLANLRQIAAESSSSESV